MGPGFFVWRNEFLGSEMGWGKNRIYIIVLCGSHEFREWENATAGAKTMVDEAKTMVIDTKILAKRQRPWSKAPKY
jgi:hypothetical protein